MNKKPAIIIAILLLCISGMFVLAETDKIKKNFRKGIEYTNQGKYDLAIEKFTAVITSDKDYANAYLALGIVYINKKMENEAVILLEKAIELEPGNKKAHFILARLYEKLEEEEKAVKIWEKYLELNPDDKYVEIAEKHLKRLKDKK